MEKLKIVLFQYPDFKIPAKAYGPKQTIIEALAKGFDKLGQEVITFATGDSELPGRIIPVCPKGISEGLNDKPEIQADVERIYRSIAIGELIKISGEVDVIHNHAGFTLLPIVQTLKAPVFHTLHGTYTDDHYKKIFDLYKDAGKFIPISRSQASTLPDLNYTEPIYHGIKIEDFIFGNNPKEDQLLFLSRVTRVKGTHTAIEVAKRTGKKLIIAGPVDMNRALDREYFEQEVKPHVDNEQIVYFGNADLEQKRQLLAESKAMIFPIEWSEAFGLVLAESLACGTPVIAFDSGSPKEIIDDGRTGFICPPQDVDAMVDAVGKLDQINRADCRQAAESRFTEEVMVQNYLELFKRELQK